MMEHKPNSRWNIVEVKLCLNTEYHLRRESKQADDTFRDALLYQSCFDAVSGHWLV